MEIKTIIITAVTLLAIGCASNPIQPTETESAETTITEQSDHITITGKIDGNPIRWDFPARDGSFKIQLSGRGPYTEFYEYDVKAVLFWYFENSMLIVDDPNGYFTGSNYVLTLWR